MRTRNKIAAAFVLLNLTAAVYAARSGRSRGRMLGIPYDFTSPGPEKARAKLWSSERRIISGPVFGAGWSLNMREIGRRLGLVAGDLDQSDEDKLEDY